MSCEGNKWIDREKWGMEGGQEAGAILYERPDVFGDYSLMERDSALSATNSLTERDPPLSNGMKIATL